MNFFKTSLHAGASLLIFSNFILHPVAHAMDDEDANPSNITSHPIKRKNSEDLSQPPKKKHENSSVLCDEEIETSEASSSNGVKALALENYRDQAYTIYHAALSATDSVEKVNHLKRLADVMENVLAPCRNPNPTFQELKFAAKANYYTGRYIQDPTSNIDYKMRAAELWDRAIDTNPTPTAQDCLEAASAIFNFAYLHSTFSNESHLFERSATLCKYALDPTRNPNPKLRDYKLAAQTNQFAGEYSNDPRAKAHFFAQASTFWEMNLNPTGNPTPDLEDYREAATAHDKAGLLANQPNAKATFFEGAAKFRELVLAPALNPEPEIEDLQMAAMANIIAGCIVKDQIAKERYSMRATEIWELILEPNQNPDPDLEDFQEAATAYETAAGINSDMDIKVQYFRRATELVEVFLEPNASLEDWRLAAKIYHNAGVTLYNETYLWRAIELWKRVLDPTRNPSPKFEDQNMLTEEVDFLKGFTHYFSSMAIADR